MNFDRIAPWYQAMELLGMGRALRRRREEFLPDFTPEHGLKRVLLLGDGDGRFLAALLATNPALKIDTVDSSQEMLRLARRRVERLLAASDGPRVRFHHADALAWLPTAGMVYDAVSTHFFLDCLTEPQTDALIARLRPFLAPGATWIVSEFYQPARGLAAWRSRLWTKGLYQLFKWTTGLAVRQLPNYRLCLETSGLNLSSERIAAGGLLISQKWCCPSGTTRAQKS